MKDLEGTALAIHAFYDPLRILERIEYGLRPRTSPFCSIADCPIDPMPC